MQTSKPQQAHLKQGNVHTPTFVGLEAGRELCLSWSSQQQAEVISHVGPGSQHKPFGSQRPSFFTCPCLFLVPPISVLSSAIPPVAGMGGKSPRDGSAGAVSASCLHASPAALLGHLMSKPQGKVISLLGLWVRPSLGSRLIGVFAFRKYLRKQRQDTGELLPWHNLDLSHKQAVLTTTET